ncbi:MAG: hypothetical protein IJK52_03010 [Oscillospiraceae bacterium]|nr:hypothetical protein [Oscillospiraceae bacterium]
MAEEKDLKERLLEIAHEQHIADSVAKGIVSCLNDDKTKLADFMKVYEFFMSIEKDSAKEDGIPDGLENADFSRCTDDELRGLLAKLERALREQDAETAPEISVPLPEAARGGVEIRLEDFL